MGDMRINNAYVAVPSGRIFVRTWMPDAATTTTPIILLHDSLGCVEMWRDFPEALARRVHSPVIAYDRLGFGQSTARLELPSVNFIREEAEEIFPTLLRALAITEFVLFGHSVGGAMALMIAASPNNQCKAVISESAQAFVEERTLDGIHAAQATFSNPDHFNKLKRWHSDKAGWVLRAWTEVWLAPDFASWSLDLELCKVQCPVLVIHGDSDEYGSIAFPQRIVRGVKGPAESVLLQGCGHVPHREQREEVLRSIDRFIVGGVVS